MRIGLSELRLPDLRGFASDLHAIRGWNAALVNAARAAGPPLLFGLRSLELPAILALFAIALGLFTGAQDADAANS